MLERPVLLRYGVGLKRRGFSAESQAALKEAFKILYKRDLTTAQALDRIRTEIGTQPETESLVDFVSSSERGIAR